MQSRLAATTLVLFVAAAACEMGEDPSAAEGEPWRGGVDADCDVQTGVDCSVYADSKALHDTLVAALNQRGLANVDVVNLDLNRDASPPIEGTPDWYDLDVERGVLGFEFDSGDTNVSYWYPQGITGFTRHGSEFLVVSWYHNLDKGDDPNDPVGIGVAAPFDNKGTRLTFIDITDPSAIEYRHVLLVEACEDEFGNVVMTPMLSSDPDKGLHAGGIAYLDGKIYVTDTRRGFRRFDIDDIFEVDLDPNRNRLGFEGANTWAFGYQYVMVQEGRVFADLPDIDGDKQNYSFVSVDWTDPDHPLLMSGAYDRNNSNDVARVLRWQKPDTLDLSHILINANIPSHLQGAAKLGDVVFTIRSGSVHRTHTFRFSDAAFDPDFPRTRYRTHHGPEDMFLNPDFRDGNLWTLTEHPGDRYVFSLDADLYTNEAVGNFAIEGAQRTPAVASNAIGRHVVVWRDDQGQDGFYNIHARVFGADGVQAVPQLRANPIAAGQQQKPDVGMAADGSFVVVWQDDSNNNGFYNIRGAGYDALGQLQWSRTLNDVTAGQQRRPAISVAPNGDFVVVWEDDRNNNAFYNIRGKGFFADGSDGWSERRINDGASGQQLKPDVILRPDGTAVVVWEDDQDNNTVYNIWGKGLTNIGGELWPDQRINTDTPGQQRRPEIAAAPNGEAIVVWEDNRNGAGNKDIYGVLIDDVGDPIWGDLILNDATSGTQRRPAVDSRSDGRFVVTWEDDQGNDGYYNVAARTFSLGGVGESQRRVNVGARGQQGQLGVSYADTGHTVVVWRDDNDNNLIGNIYVHRSLE